MPALFAIGQHPALEEVRSNLIEGEALFVFFDDSCLVCEPQRVSLLFEQVQVALFRHAHIEVRLGSISHRGCGPWAPPKIQVGGGRPDVASSSPGVGCPRRPHG